MNANWICWCPAYPDYKIPQTGLPLPSHKIIGPIYLNPALVHDAINETSSSKHEEPISIQNNLRYLLRCQANNPSTIRFGLIAFLFWIRIEMDFDIATFFEYEGKSKFIQT